MKITVRCLPSLVVALPLALLTSCTLTKMPTIASSEGAAVGSPRYEYLVGEGYRLGIGVPTNQSAAIEWYRKAADKGYAPAQTALGVAYEEGLGVPRDIQTAALYYRTAAEASDVNGCYHMGRCYYYGTGVESNMANAAKWFRIAAEGGHPRAQSELGSLLFGGAVGVRQNPAEAVAWYRKSALQGDRRAMNNLSYCLEAGCGVKASPDEAAAWCLKAAQAGDDIAETRLGIRFIDGTWPTLPQNPSAGANLLRQAAEQTNFMAMMCLAHCYESGTGVKLSRPTAKEWYNKACDAGGVSRISEVAFQYLMNAESIEDYPEAIRWLDRAAAAGQSDACLMLADFYANATEDVDLKALLQEQGFFDKVKAAYLFMQAARGQYFPGETSASNQYAEAERLAPAYTNAARFLVYDSKRTSEMLRRRFRDNTLPPEAASIGAALILATNPPGSAMIGDKIVQGTVTTNADGTVVTVLDVFGDEIPPEAIARMPELTNATIYRPAFPPHSNRVGTTGVRIFQ